MVRHFAAVALPLAVAAAPLKIIIMAGQSNMQGHGYVDHANKGFPTTFTLEQLVKDNPSEYGRLKKNGNWVTRSDVWTYYTDKGSFNPGGGGKGGTWHGDLTVGYGGDKGRGAGVGSWEMGPELGFGWALGDALDTQVLLLKTAWGGKDLDVDYRPPSMPQGNKTGYFYRKMVEEVRTVTSNLASLFPDYSGSYELAGFAWHQGWNDACGKVGGGDDVKGCETKHHCYKADPSRYEENLVALIKDLRAEFSDLPGGKTLPVSIGNTGLVGWDKDLLVLEPSDQDMLGVELGGVGDNIRQYVIPAQLAVGNSTLHPEFEGTVLTAETRGFAHRNGDSPGKQGYHWFNNCDSYWRVGKAMGENMVKLMKREVIV